MQVLPAELAGGTGVDTALPGPSLCWQGSNSDVASDSYTGPIQLPHQNGHHRMVQKSAHQPVVQQLMVPEPPARSAPSMAMLLFSMKDQNGHVQPRVKHSA
ncbi:hypothetical protein WJX84_011359 [Apatococcus fuscideae]|uniref:Uncharacterized protein n=1 Tax=Apatococcus fuscideae TaxID=2026836 RepID=A0AAW1T7L7_9CHLO